MKTRVSATIDKKTADLIDAILKKGNYRNKSHIIEKAIEKMAEEDK
jgi:Arc/MetJ-type ribon-helix-helix transcriptional regulator